MSHQARLESFLRFAAGGVVSLSVTLGTTALLHEVLGVGEPVSAAGGFATALTVNFLVMRYYVFHGSAVPPLRQAIMFLTSSGLFRGGEYLGFLALNLILGLSYPIALPIVLCVSFVLKFLVYDRWIFASTAGAQGVSSSSARWEGIWINRSPKP